MRFLEYADLAPGRYAKMVDKVRAAIERDDFRSADVKKLHAGDYYRAKLDYTNRLLVQFVRVAGETACLALEIIEQHAYDRSRFLRGARVDEAQIEAEAPAEPAKVETRVLRYLHPSRPEFEILDKPLSFDDAQEAVVRRSPPVILVGSAGSGKTALTLTKLRHVPGDVAYVTQSAFLAETARGLYFAHGYENDAQNAEFLSLRELLESIRVPTGRAAQLRDFRAWFERHKRDVRFADAHQCFEEIRGVITSRPEGPLSREAYLALGLRQSIFSSTQREVVYALFEKYRAWLKDSGLFDPNLVAHAYLAEVTPRYDFVVIDEAQDLTNVELALVLRTLKTPGTFFLCGDANQIVHPNFFSWSAVKSMFFRDASLGEDRHIAVLDANFRNARAVTETANALLKVKHARFGSIDKESNALVRPVAEDEGQVTGLVEGDAVLRDLDQKTRRSTQFAVIVARDEHKEEARKRFATPLLFSVHEAKGLEYENVVLYRFVSSERTAYAELAEGVGRGALEVEELEYRRARDKGDKSLEVYKFFVNALYVAITRAVRRAYLVESDTKHPLLGLLGLTFASDVTAVETKASTIEDWQREAHKLELQGKDEQAKAIRQTILQITPVPWPVLDREGYRSVADKALAPQSISTKAKQTLFDYACFQEDRPLAERLERAAGFAPAARYDEVRGAYERKQLAPYQVKNFKEIIWQTERHGIDFRTPMNLTPLMMAAYAGNVPLVEALVARGASLKAVDQFGKAPMHWALKRAYDDAAFAQGPFAALWDLLAPYSIDVQSDGQLHKLGRQQGEYLLFALSVILHKRMYRTRIVFLPGITSGDLVGGAVEQFPDTVLHAPRKKRTYVNAVLARNEPGASYTPNRKLWTRVRRGHYVLNPDLLLRSASGEDEAAWVPIEAVLGSDLLREHALGAPRGTQH